MNTSARQGLGFEYEDEIRLAAVIHMYLNIPFIDEKEYIKKLILGGNKYQYKTDDLILETENNKYCIQVKKTINGLKSESFKSFINNAIDDFKIDPNSHYCLVTETISQDLIIPLNNVISKIKGSLSLEDFNLISLTKKEKMLLTELKNILKFNDYFEFIKKLKIFIINEEERKKYSKIVLSSINVENVENAYNSFLVKTKEIKRNNQTIDAENFHKIYDFINYSKNNNTNKEINVIFQDYMKEILKINIHSNESNEYKKIYDETMVVINKITYSENFLLDSNIYRTLNLLNFFLKFSLSIYIDTKFLNSIFKFESIPNTHLFIFEFNDIAVKIDKKISIKDSMFGIFNNSLVDIKRHLKFIDNNGLYDMSKQYDDLNDFPHILLSKNISFYKNKLHNYYLIEIINLINKTIKNINIIDLIDTSYKKDLHYFSIIKESLNNESINFILDFLNLSKLYSEYDIDKLKYHLSCLDVWFILFVTMFTKIEKITLSKGCLNKFILFGNTGNKIVYKYKEIFLKYIDYCDKENINLINIIEEKTINKFYLKLEEEDYNENKLYELMFQNYNNSWYSKNINFIIDYVEKVKDSFDIISLY